MLDRAKALLAFQANLMDIALNGVLVYRNEPGRKPSWCLRWRVPCPETGAKRHRNIDLGDDPELLALARDVVAKKRQRREQDRAARAAKINSAAQLRQFKPAEAEVIARVHGSRRYVQAVRMAFREYCKKVPNPNADGFLADVDSFNLRRRRRGRPYASRLW
jgi:hypothetical protein